MYLSFTLLGNIKDFGFLVHNGCQCIIELSIFFTSFSRIVVEWATIEIDKSLHIKHRLIVAIIIFLKLDQSMRPFNVCIRIRLMILDQLQQYRVSK